MTISERIKYLRMNQPGGKLTREEFAKTLGLTASQICNLEDSENRLKNGIPDSLLLLICSTYNVRIEWLKEGEGEIYNQGDEFRRYIKNNPTYSPYFLSLVLMASRIWDDEQWDAFKTYVDRLKKEALQ